MRRNSSARRQSSGVPGIGLLSIGFWFIPLLSVASAVQTHPAVGRELMLAVDFRHDLGPFAYDDTWGCGFGGQSDFMGDLSQVTVANDVATITAERRDTPCGREFASGIMSTRDSFSQQYGYFEARILFTGGTGLWPAFWMQPADGSWPPEIDVMEAYPNANGAWPGPNRYMAALHYGADNSTIDIVHDVGDELADEWHIYGLDWQPDSLAFFFDGEEVGRITAHIPDTAMYVILNLAVGSWTGRADATTPERSLMRIDYLRVWR